MEIDSDSPAKVHEDLVWYDSIPRPGNREQNSAPEESAAEEAANAHARAVDESTSPAECTIAVPEEAEEGLVEPNYLGTKSDYQPFLDKPRALPINQKPCCGANGLGIFGFVMLWFLPLIPVFLILLVGSLLHLCTCGKAKKGCFSALNKTIIAVFTVPTRIILFLCCWIQIRTHGFDANNCKKMGSSGRPVLFVANHASLFDIFMLITVLPFSKVTNVKLLVSFKLFNIPFLGNLLYAMGHLPVRNSCKTDDEALRRVTSGENENVIQEFIEHIQQGGHGGWFPEGRVNFKNPHQVLMFKKGGFAAAVDLDVEVWCISFIGCGVPGTPARIGASISCLCDSTHSLLAEAGLSLDKSRDDCLMFLAGHSQATVQKGIDNLVTEGCIEGHKTVHNRGI